MPELGNINRQKMEAKNLILTINASHKVLRCRNKSQVRM